MEKELTPEEYELRIMNIIKENKKASQLVGNLSKYFKGKKKLLEKLLDEKFDISIILNIKDK